VSHKVFYLAGLVGLSSIEDLVHEIKKSLLEGKQESHLIVCLLLSTCTGESTGYTQTTLLGNAQGVGNVTIV